MALDDQAGACPARGCSGQAVPLTPFCEAHRNLFRLLAQIEACPIDENSSAAQLQHLRSLLLQAGKYLAAQSEVHAGLCNLALTDDLTGLYNHRGFLILGTQLLALARRSERDVLLFFADVDHLKWINDRYGHSVGDAVLKRFAAAIRQTFRHSDIAARYGGDEFVVLAWETQDENEQAILARLNDAVKELNAADLAFQLSVSVGVSRFDHEHPFSLAEMLMSADSIMYRHKRPEPPTVAVATPAG